MPILVRTRLISHLNQRLYNAYCSESASGIAVKAKAVTPIVVRIHSHLNQRLYNAYCSENASG